MRRKERERKKKWRKKEKRITDDTRIGVFKGKGRGRKPGEEGNGDASVRVLRMPVTGLA